MNIRFAIMGAGVIARKFAQAVTFTEGARVVAVASQSAQRAEAFAKEQHIPVWGDYASILARDDVDVVYIATTQNMHADCIRQVLEAGKHCLCEKPMFLTEKDGLPLAALAREKGLFLMEAMWSRYLPMVRKAKEWIEAGLIGKVQMISGTVGFHGGNDPASRLLSAELGGGVMYDIGVYLVEIASFLAGEPIQEVQGMVRRHPVTGVDTVSSALLRFTTVDAAIQCCLTGCPREVMLVTGDKGCIELPTPHMGNTALRYDGGRQLVETFSSTYPEGNGFVYQVTEVMRCLRAGLTESPDMPLDVSLETARVYDRLL